MEYSCKNIESTSEIENTSVDKKELILLSAIKTPVVRGIGGRGVRIILNVQIKDGIQLDSIVYNGRSCEVSELKKNDSSKWVEGYFYDDNEFENENGSQSYKAEGEFCHLYYNIDGKAETLLIQKLEKGTDNTLWK